MIKEYIKKSLYFFNFLVISALFVFHVFFFFSHNHLLGALLEFYALALVSPWSDRKAESRQL